MSVEASSWAFAVRGVKSGPKFVLVAIANVADKAGVGFPGRVTLAQATASRPETVSENLGRLADAGLIARVQRRRGNGSRTSDWIILAPHHPDRAPMADALPDDYPDDEVANLARTSSGGESSPEVYPPGQVRNSGAPEPPGNRQDADAGAHASDPVDVDAIRARWPELAEPERKLIIAVTAVARSRKSVKPWKAERLLEHAQEFGDRDLCFEAGTFQHFWTEGVGENRPIRDVVATARNWLRSAPSAAKRDANRRRPPAQRQRDAERAERNARRLAAFDRLQAESED